jgi:DNA-binding transcriptional MocR family regulator
VPDGGFYVWLTLPAQVDAKSMLPRAVKQLVAYTPGTAFYADGNGRNNIRLSFCYPTPEFIREGVRRLSAVISGELELLDTFSQNSPLAAVATEPTVTSPPPNLG